MKLILLLIFVLSLYGDDIKRIDSIVSDIEKLREDYSRTKEKLSSCQSELMDEKQRNIAISLDATEDEFLVKEQEYIKTIKNLENRIKILKNIEKPNKVCNKKIVKTKIIKVKDDENPFPKLLLKKDKKVSKSKIIYFKPSSFRVKKETFIYDKPNGKKVAKWEKNRSFTSNQKIQNWIKITGYFVDKKWRKATEPLWIKSTDVKQRDKK